MEDTNKIENKITLLREEIKKVIIGQEDVVNSLLISLFSKWHILLEWAPGLAKTLVIDTLSKTLDLSFSRIQFTPDLLPSDLLWAEIYNQSKWEFYTKKWPIFSNFVLADEINRAPSKVQSALLESMQEKQVTIWDHTYKLDEPFLVLATQNPIEQEWTYNLPEAQLDRFLFKILVDYPTPEQEIEIMKTITNRDSVKINNILNRDDLFEIQKKAEDIFVDHNIYSYIKDIIFATRNPEDYGLTDLWEYISYWASPRASIAFIKTSKILALMNGRDHVLPEDIKSLSYNILRHRIGLSYEALAEWVSSDDIITSILNSIKV